MFFFYNFQVVHFKRKFVNFDCYFVFLLKDVSRRTVLSLDSTGPKVDRKKHRPFRAALWPHTCNLWQIILFKPHKHCFSVRSKVSNPYKLQQLCYIHLALGATSNTILPIRLLVLGFIVLT